MINPFFNSCQGYDLNITIEAGEVLASISPSPTVKVNYTWYLSDGTKYEEIISGRNVALLDSGNYKVIAKFGTCSLANYFTI